MREIKFRAWDVGQKIWRNPYTHALRCDNINPNFSNSLLESCAFFAPYSATIGEQIIQQYTGLKDKNGKDIYEGDILSIYLPDLNILKKDTSSVLYPIIKGDIVDNVLIGEVNSDFDEGILSQFSYYINGYLPFSRLKSLTSVNNIEVIGNIFENPELVSK